MNITTKINNSMNMLPKINNSMSMLPKINNSMNMLPKINNSMVPINDSMDSVNASMNTVVTNNDSMPSMIELTTSMGTLSPIVNDFTWEAVDTPYTSKEKGALELFTEELSATYLTTIITLIHQKGSCFGIDCFKCPLSVGYICSQSTPIDYTYKLSVQWLIDTYGEKETKELIMEILI
jgi:hypothetical protein